MGLFDILIPGRRKSSRFSTNEEVVMASRRYSKKERRFIEQRLNIPIWEFRDKQSWLEAGTGKLWAMFRASHIVAATVMSTDVRVISRKPTADGFVEDPVSDPELDRLLTSPNPHDTWEDLIYMWVPHMKFTGEAYWLKDKMVGNGRPQQLWPLLPQYVKIHPSREEGKKVSHYSYEVNGEVINYAEEEIVHFRRPHPMSVFRGIGDVEPAEPLFGEAINRANYEEKFMENGAQPSGVFIKKGQPIGDDDEWERVERQVNKKYAGKENVGKLMMVDAEFDFKRMGLTAAEMESVESRKMSVEEQFLAMGVPLSIAGFSSAANYATFRGDMIMFKRNEVVPLLAILTGKINHKDSGIVPKFRDNYYLRYEVSGLHDVEQVWKDKGEAYREGVYTPNEMREFMGDERVDNPLLDMHYFPKDKVPVEMLGLSEGPTAEEMADYTGPRPLPEPGDAEEGEEVA